VRFFDELLMAFVQYKNPSCSFCTQCAANLVIEHDGSVYPCDFFVDPQWKLGTLGEQTLDQMAQSPRARQFLQRKAQLSSACQGCRWRCLCQGDCPKYRLNKQGEPTAHSYFCEAYQMLFDHTLPFLRQMKKQLLLGSSPQARAWREAERALDRNRPCPCGSGSKFKKCCMTLKGDCL